MLISLLPSGLVFAAELQEPAEEISVVLEEDVAGDAAEAITEEEGEAAIVEDDGAAAYEEAVDEEAVIDEEAIADEDEPADEEAAIDDEEPIDEEEPVDEEAIIDDEEPAEEEDDAVIEVIDPELDLEFVLGEGGGIQAIHMVRFMIDGVEYTSQFRNTGEKAMYFEAPKALYPANMVSFRGWYASLAADALPYDFNLPVTADLTLYARFSDKYLVQYLDGFNEIFLSKEVTQGANAVAPTAAEIATMPIPQDKVFDFWTLNQATNARYMFNTPLTEDIKLYPVMKNIVYVYFVTYGSEIAPVTLTAGQTVSRPAVNPTRKNYSFVRWTATRPDGAEYNWSAPVNADLELYAVWTPIPNSTTYKVVWWLESANLGVTPVPGTPAHYDYAGEQVRTGTPGQTVTIVNELPPAPSGGYLNTDPVRYSQFDQSFPTVISGAGNTIVNVYLKRKVYAIRFNLGDPARFLKFNSTGQTYYGDQYVINVKYEQDITDIWPSTATVTFGGTAGFSFVSWAGAAGTYGESNNYVTRRNDVDVWLMPKDPNWTGYTLSPSSTAAPGTYNVRYWIEEYPGQPMNLSRQYTKAGVTKTYILAPQYSQSQMGQLNAKSILGLTNAGRDFSNTELGAGDGVPARAFQNFYYDRNKWSLIFDVDGAPPMAPVTGIMFEQPVAQFKPSSAPAWPNHAFINWYKDPNHTMLFDFNTAKMLPNANLIVFAKYEAQDYFVTFIDSGVTLGTQGVAEGDPVNFNNLWYNGFHYEIGNFAPGKGTFIGWQYYPQYSTVLQPYPVDLLVYRDFNLYAHWNTGGFKIIYLATGAGPGSTVPVDDNTYNIGTLARVLQGDMKAPVLGQTYIGWRVADTGMTYYPDSLVPVTGPMDMYPYFVDDANVTYIEFSNNWAANPETQTRAVEKNTTNPLPDERIFTKIPPNSSLVGWSENADGSGTIYPRDGTVYVGNNPLKLYAIWDSNEVKITYNGNGAMNFTTGQVTVTRFTNVNIPASAPVTDVKKIGYEFLGWSRELNNKNTIITGNVYITDNLTVYACWSDNLVYKNVTFNSNGADEGPATTVVPVLINDTVNLDDIGPKNLIKYGYDQDGWSLTANVPSTKRTTLQITADTPVYALWSDGPAQQVILSYHANDGVRTIVDTKTFLKHEEVNVNTGAPVLTRTGYLPDGWAETDTSTVKLTVVRLSADKTVYQIWDYAPDVDLIFAANGGKNKANETSKSVTLPSNATYTLATYEPKGDDMFTLPGSEFIGWALEKDVQSSISATVTLGVLEKRVYAFWESRPNVNVQFYGNGGTNQSGINPVLKSVQVNSTVTLASIQPTGADEFKFPGKGFDGWSTTANPPYNKVTTLDIKLVGQPVYATWTDLPDVDLVFNGNGGINKDNETSVTVKVPANSKPTLSTVEPTGDKKFRKEGFELTGWSTEKDDDTTIVPDIELGTTGTEVFAFWTARNPVNVLFNGNGGTNVSGVDPVPVSVPVNSTRLVSAIEPTGNNVFKKAGYVLSGWSTIANDAASKKTSIDIDFANYPLFALWTKVPDVNLTFDGNGGYNSTYQTSVNVPVEVNSNVILATIQPTGANMFTKQGFTFGGWTLEKDNFLTLTPDLDIGLTGRIVYAYWTNAPKVNVVFNGNGGYNKANQGSVSKQVDGNTKVLLYSIQPTGDEMFRLAGYMFDGWSTSQGLNNAADRVVDLDMATTDKPVYAIWRAMPNVNIIFFGNGGVNKLWQTTYYASVQVNQVVQLNAYEPTGDNAFKKSGHIQAGWTLIADNFGSIQTELDIGFTNRIVYAYWQTAADVDLVFNGNGGENADGEDEVIVKVPVNTKASLNLYKPADDKMFKLPGYILDGWSTSSGPNNAANRVVDIDIETSGATLYAIWRKLPDVYVVFFGNGGYNDAWQSTYYAAVQVNSTVTLATIAPTGANMFKNSGYIWTAWTEKVNDLGSAKTTVDIGFTNKIVYAYWDAAPQGTSKVKFDGNGGKNKANLEQVEVNVTGNAWHLLSFIQPTGDDMFKKAGYVLDGWSTAKDDETTRILNIYVEVGKTEPVFAIWKKVPDVQLTFDGNGGFRKDAPNLGTWSINVPVNSTQNLAALLAANNIEFAKNGFVLDGWTTVQNDDTKKVENLEIGTVPTKVFAFYVVAPKYKLIIDANGGTYIKGGNKLELEVDGNTTVNIIDRVRAENSEFINFPEDYTFFKSDFDENDIYKVMIIEAFTYEKNNLNTKVENVPITNKDETVYIYWIPDPNT